MSGRERRETAVLFLLVVLGHAGAVCVDLVVAPDVLLELPGLGVAVVNRRRAAAAHPFAALREARRCQRRRRKRHAKRGYKRADPHHGRSPLCFLRESSPCLPSVRRDRVNPKAAPSRGRNGPHHKRKRLTSCGRSIAGTQRRRRRSSAPRIAAGLNCSNSWNRRARKPYEMVMRAERTVPEFGARIGRENLLVPQGGFEPSTYRLRSDCSAVELLRRPERTL